MSLILAPSPGYQGVSMAPVVRAVRLGLQDSMAAVDKALAQVSKPKAPAKRKAPKKDAPL